MMGHTKDSFGVEILILFSLTLCMSTNSELVLRPIGSEYQPVSIKSGGEFCVKRQFTVIIDSLLH